MTEQAVKLGVTIVFIDAVDAREFGAARHEIEIVGTPFGRVSDGDVACMLSHRKVWRLIVEAGDERAVILEDDALLSTEFARYMEETSWIPPEARVVKLERYGRPERLLVVDRQSRDVGDRKVLRFYGRNVGSAGYIISRTAAAEMLSRTQKMFVPVDQVLFNPWASGAFSWLMPYVVEPALCEQDRVRTTSDIARPKADWRRQVHAGLTELSLVGRLLFWQVRLLGRRMRGTVVRSRLTFRN